MGDRRAVDDGPLAAAALVEQECQRDPSTYATSRNLRMNVNPMGPANAAANAYRESSPSTATSTNLSAAYKSQNSSFLSFSTNEQKKRLAFGVMVLTLKSGSEAADVGIRPGDRVHRINGELLPLELGHKQVADRLRRASRPSIVTLERFPTTNDKARAASIKE